MCCDCGCVAVQCACVYMTVCGFVRQRLSEIERDTKREIENEREIERLSETERHRERD